MSDADLRALERAQRAAPSVESEAALLRARLRAGTLAPERLELAAYAGHEAARAVVSEPYGTWIYAEPNPNREWWGPGARPHEWHKLGPWVAGLARWEPAVQVRAAVAAARVALPEHELRRGETCCCGSLSRSHGMDDGHGAVHACDYYGMPECACPPEPDPDARRTIEAAEAVLRGEEPDEDPYAHQRAWDEGWSALWRTLRWIPAPWASEGARESEILSAAHLTSEAAVREAVQRSLIAWALA